MENKFLTSQKYKLEKIKESIKEELKTFATENPKFAGDWNTNFPKHDNGVGSSALEDATDEVEEYITRLPIEFNLETRLRDINSALEKIKNGKYGICEKCKKPISQARLEVSPEAKLCSKCQSK